MNEQDEWVRIANSLDALSFSMAGIAVADAEGKKICIGRWKDEYFAFAHGCPHAGALLSEGFIDPLGNVVCPLHHYRFNIKNGRNSSGEGYFLKRWPLRISEKGVFTQLTRQGG